jgi:hypothetical protein
VETVTVLVSLTVLPSSVATATARTLMGKPVRGGKGSRPAAPQSFLLRVLDVAALGA